MTRRWGAIPIVLAVVLTAVSHAGANERWSGGPRSARRLQFLAPSRNSIPRVRSDAAAKLVAGCQGHHALARSMAWVRGQGSGRANRESPG